MFGIFKENGRLINKLHHGIKIDLYIPAYNNFGFVAGIAGGFMVKVPNTPHVFNNIGYHAHVGIDYKISN